MQLNIIILAAGEGKRMHSALPKVLHKIGGKPMLERVIATALSLKPNNIYVVYGKGGDKIKNELEHLKVIWVYQEKPLGTGHAVAQALPKLNDQSRTLIIYGDVPLLTSNLLQELITTTPIKEIGIIVANLDNPEGFGRIIRNIPKGFHFAARRKRSRAAECTPCYMSSETSLQQRCGMKAEGYSKNKIIGIVEQKDANKKQLNIKEINSGIFLVPTTKLKKYLPKLSNKNKQSEYYLTDIISLAVKDKCPIQSVTAEINQEILGVNDRHQLANLERYYQQCAAKKLSLQGVTLLDPNRFDLRGELKVGRDVTIDINVIISGKVIISDNTQIDSNVILHNAKIGKNVHIKPNTIIEDAIIEDECVIGPFARIRPDTLIKNKAKVGNFVEIKNTELGNNSKASHLTYLGDAMIGKDVNIGAGTITCNYDGVNKYRTIIEDGVFVGSNSQLVAPVKIGKNATIGAGSTITDDAPPNQLTLGRARQCTIKNWQRPIPKGFQFAARRKQSQATECTETCMSSETILQQRCKFKTKGDKKKN